MLTSSSYLSAPATALRLLGAINDTKKAQGNGSERASSAASFEIDAQSISFASAGGMDAQAFVEGLDSVSDEWEFAQGNSRRIDQNGGNVIDGQAFQKLTDAILANRDKFPDGEFTIKLAWSDGASIETTIPPRAPPRVHSVSISAVFGTTIVPPAVSSSVCCAAIALTTPRWPLTSSCCPAPNTRRA
jgi:hypothetical protein